MREIVRIWATILGLLLLSWAVLLAGAWAVFYFMGWV